jgi:hypothetical protein
MGFFSGGILGRIFGSAEAGDKLVDGAVSAIDKLWYTEEEKADDRAKAKTEVMAVYTAWLQSTSGSRIARRIIAFAITMPWCIGLATSGLLSAIAPFIEGTQVVQQRVNGVIVNVMVLNSDKVEQAADRLAEHANANNTLIGVVLLFYFGGPMASSGVEALVSRWAGNKSIEKQ